MGEKTKRPRSATGEPPEATDVTFPGEALDLAETTTKVFRTYLNDFLEAQLSGKPTHPDWMTLIATGSLTSILRMIEQGGECPLSVAEFSRIVAESSFGEVIRGVEPSVGESRRREQGNWNARNQRRLALIRKSLTAELTPDEQSDLERLQAELDKRLESHDDRLLEELQRMKNAVEHLPDGP
jgi:hypothetical protein